MSILIDDQKFIWLKFHYLETIGNNGVTKFKFIQNVEDFERYRFDPDFKELNTGWKVITWSEHNSIYAESRIGGGEIDFMKFRDLKLKSCLKTWDLRGETGKKVPITSETIDHLHPDVANELLSGFEKVTEVGAEDLKSLEMSGRAFFEGKHTTQPPPPIVYEFFVCKHLSCSFEYVRKMPMPDFLKALKLCLAWEGIEKQWEAEMATVGMPKKSF